MSNYMGGYSRLNVKKIWHSPDVALCVARDLEFAYCNNPSQVSPSTVHDPNLICTDLGGDLVVSSWEVKKPKFYVISENLVPERLLERDRKLTYKTIGRYHFISCPNEGYLDKKVNQILAYECRQLYQEQRWVFEPEWEARRDMLLKILLEKGGYVFEDTFLHKIGYVYWLLLSKEEQLNIFKTNLAFRNYINLNFASVDHFIQLAFETDLDSWFEDSKF